MSGVCYFSESKTMQTLLVVLYIAGGVIGTIIFILMLMCLAQRCFSKNPKEYYVSFKFKRKVKNVGRIPQETTNQVLTLKPCQNLPHSIFTARIRRMGKVMFSVCPHWGGGGQVRVQLGGVRSESSRGGSGQSPARGGQVRVQPGGGSGQSPARGGQVSPAGGGQVSPAGGGGQSTEGGSASCALLRAVCLLRSRRRTFLLKYSFKN